MSALQSRVRVVARVWRPVHFAGFVALAVAAALAGCGGGGDASPSSGGETGGGAGDSAVRAAAIQVPTANISGSGWALVPPAHQLEKAGAVQACPQSRPNCKFYVDSTYTGAERNGGKNTPFTSLSEVQDAIARSLIVSGDSILLKCGAVFRGGLKLEGTTPSKPLPPKGLRIGAYDGSLEDCSDDNLPVIRGTQMISGAWAQEQSGSPLWKIGVTNTVQRVFANGVPLTKARYPNAGVGGNFLPTSVAAENGTIKEFLVSKADKDEFARWPENSLTGATVFIRTTLFSIETSEVEKYDATSGLITLSKALKDPVVKGAGYIFQGKRWMADQPGEWFCESDSSGTSALFVYGAVPAGSIEIDDNFGYHGVKAGNTQAVTDGLTIERIRFEGQGYASIEVTNGANIKIRGIESVNAGAVGVRVDGVGLAGVEIVGNRVLAPSSVGIHSDGVTAARVNRNYVEGTGRFDPASVARALPMQAAIRVGSQGGEASGNFVLNSSGAGLMFDSPYQSVVTTSSPVVTAKITNNLIVNSCLRRSDCGGIYTTGIKKPSEAQLTETWLLRSSPRAVVTGNVVVGNKSNTDGCPVPDKDPLTNLDRPNVCDRQAIGIYLDDFTSNVNVINNAVSSAEVGIYVHNGSHNLIQGNKVRGATHASFLASDDTLVAASSEIMRGNVVKENLFVSRRAVALQNWDTSTAGSVGSLLMYNVPHTYAQLWLHKGDATKFFSVDSAGRPGNRSELNDTLSLSKVEQPAILRMGLGGQLVEYSGAVWGVRGTVNNKATLEEMALPRWLAIAPPSDLLSADKESSPVSYKPYVVKQGAPASLIDNFVGGAVWTPVNGTLFTMLTGTQPLAQCGGALSCGEAKPASGDSLVASKAFASKAGTTYVARFDVTAGQGGGAFNANVMVDGVAAGDGKWSSVSPNYVQSSYLKANQTKRVEHFFQASISNAYAKLFLRPSDKTATFARPLYFGGASMYPTSDLEALPSMRGLAAVAVNASSNDKRITCAELGLATSAPCPAKLYDESNAEVGMSNGEVTVPANTTLQLYVPSAKWSN